MKKQRRHNTGLAKVAVQCSADTFVVNQSLVLRINIYGENRHLRQARKRWASVWWSEKSTLIQFKYKKIIATAERNITTAERIIAYAEKNIATAERIIATAEGIIATAENKTERPIAVTRNVRI